MTTPRIESIALRLPDWMGSIRFRLTAMYSLVLFGLAAMVVGGIYLALAEQLDDATIYASEDTVEETAQDFLAQLAGRSEAAPPQTPSSPPPPKKGTTPPPPERDRVDPDDDDALEDFLKGLR